VTVFRGLFCVKRFSVALNRCAFSVHQLSSGKTLQAHEHAALKYRITFLGLTKFKYRPNDILTIFNGQSAEGLRERTEYVPQL